MKGVTWGMITWITSFATMSYAMILSSTVSDFTGEEILSQCLTMGPYLLGLGLGSFFGDRIKEENNLKALWIVEWLSAFLLPLIPMTQILAVFFYLHLSPLGTSLESPHALRLILGLSSIMSFASGLLGGSQLPLLMRLGKDQIRAEVILAISYMGPLLAGPFIIFLSGHQIPGSVLIGGVAFLQIAGLILLLKKLQTKLFPLILLSFPLMVLIVIGKFYARMETITVKASYIGTKMSARNLFHLGDVFRIIEQYGELERVRTPYQVIDFFTTPPHPEMQLNSNSTLYLNRKTQFDLYAADVYHESMIYSGLNLLSTPPQSVLILGGGDGLLLKELSEIQKIRKITMVELDQGIIEWARTNPVMKGLNDGVFEKDDKRLHLIVGDAISYLRKIQEEKFDLILIDFPFPHGHELSKLYSFEFYQLVKKVTHNETVVVIDLPIQMETSGELIHETKVILKTLKASGFSNQLPFGPVASFVAVSRKAPPLRFNYKTFPEDLELSTRLNLVRLETKMNDSEIPVNSMFRPGGI
jgi:spermidine synthase